MRRRTSTSGSHPKNPQRKGDDIADTLALNEVRETRYWLRLILRAELIGRPDRLNELIDEAGEPVAILAASANTARRRERRES